MNINIMNWVGKVQQKLQEKSFPEAVQDFLMVRSYPIRKYLRRFKPVQNCDYDELTRRIFKNELQSNSNCIDVGCHKGDILQWILDYAPQGQHYAIEPIPEMMAKLKERFTGVNLYQVALSNETGESTFELVKNYPGYSGLKRRPYDHDDVEIIQITVKTEKLDNLIPENIKIDLIKVDIEGGEFLAFQGATRILKQDQPLIIFENGHGPSQSYGFTRSELFDFLSDYGLQVSSLQGWLLNQPTLNQKQFVEIKEWMFIAHPVR